MKKFWEKLLKLFTGKVKESEAHQSRGEEYKFTWYEVDEKNPFNKRILDIRSLTQTMLAFTKDQSVAALFGKLRQSKGEEFIGSKPADAETLNTSLVYPHNGAKLAGAVYKAKCMEDKWDIYGWNDVIYFTRSWTGEVVYKAFLKLTDTELAIYKIEYCLDTFNKGDVSLAVNDVHFLMMTLALGRIYPHKIPKSISVEKEIALYSFAKFGHNCWYATYDDILDTVVKEKKVE